MKLGLGLQLDWVAPVATPPASTISSIDYDLGDPLGGGNSIVITGTNLTDATVSIDGTSQTVTSTTDTTCTFTLAAKAAGSYTLSVLNPDGGSATTSFEYWAPSTEASCTVLCEKPDYSDAGAGLWTARAGTNISSPGLQPPAVGGAPAFDGGTWLTTGAISGLIKTTATKEGSMACVVNAASAGTADSGAPYDEAGLWADEGATIGLSYSTDGARGWCSDGAYRQVARALATGSVHTAMMRFKSGVDVNVNVDGTWGTPAALGTAAPNGASTSLIGTNYVGTAYITGTMAAFMTFNVKITDAVATKIAKWARQRHSSA